MDRFSSSGSQNKDLLADRLQRIRRVLRFAGERLQAIRRDHEAFWLVPQEQRPRLTPEQIVRVDAFKRKAELAQRLVETGQRIVELAAGQTPTAALITTGRYDPDLLANTVRELDALIVGVQAATRQFNARALGLPERPGDPHAPGRPAASAGATAARNTGELAERKTASGQLMRWLQKLVDLPEVATAPPAPAVRGPVAAYMQELAGAAETARVVLEEVSTELEILRAALSATALPVPRRPWDEVPPCLDAEADAARLDPVQTSWLMPVARRLYVDDQAVRKAHVSVTQWLEARELLATASRHQRALASMLPDRQRVVMHDLHPGKLRAVVLPLTHLHTTFDGVPVLARLFPAPEPAEDQQA